MIISRKARVELFFFGERFYLYRCVQWQSLNSVLRASPLSALPSHKASSQGNLAIVVRANAMQYIQYIFYILKFTFTCIIIK